MPVIPDDMVTIRNGWAETRYLPLDAEALAAALVEHRAQGGRHFHFVTGAVSGPAGRFPRWDERRSD
ncbi:hypothetical protein [Rhodobacter sp. 24-YEA-8]|uniref:hypothetical protein n=1 Tax=Rhodobacter sp. 24-YEA-8 TaxID=1884310 RepID=UPI00115FF0CF|nr:hypothetical protein [Rhodobacter sp. 24-YEA-8]